MRKTKEQNTKNQTPKTSHGITLIALIITIIVMIILVAVTVTMAVNGGLFSKAQIAGTQTNETVKKEQELGNGRIKIGDTWYDSPQDYVNNKLSANQGNGESEDETTEGGEFDSCEEWCKRCNSWGRISCWYCPELGDYYVPENDVDNNDFTSATSCMNCSLYSDGDSCEGCGGTINVKNLIYCRSCDTFYEKCESVGINCGYCGSGMDDAATYVQCSKCNDIWRSDSCDHFCENCALGVYFEKWVYYCELCDENHMSGTTPYKYIPCPFCSVD